MYLASLAMAGINYQSLHFSTEPTVDFTLPSTHSGQFWMNRFGTLFQMCLPFQSKIIPNIDLRSNILVIYCFYGKNHEFRIRKLGLNSGLDIYYFCDLKKINSHL